MKMQSEVGVDYQLLYLTKLSQVVNWAYLSMLCFMDTVLCIYISTVAGGFFCLAVAASADRRTRDHYPGPFSRDFDVGFKGKTCTAVTDTVAAAYTAIAIDRAV